MKPFNYSQAQGELSKDTIETLAKIKEIILSKKIENIQKIKDIRLAAYENLNQLLHRNLILNFLTLDGLLSKKIKWNPEQTGGSSEPDIEIKTESGVVNVEVTTSQKPNGTIRKRMSSTLKKLDAFSGKKIYVVASEAMEKTAVNLIKKWGYKITVRKIA